MPNQPTNKCTLRPGEVCLYCGSEGKPKPKAKGPPTCDLCGKDFSREHGPRRLIRGRWRHVACILASRAKTDALIVNIANGPSVAEQIAEVKSGQAPKGGVIPALVDAAVKLATAPRRRMKRKPKKGAK